MTDDLNQQAGKRDDRDSKGRFVPGVSGNPAGRPKGSRHVLEEDVVAAFAAEFKERGLAAVSRLDDDKLCELAIKILPKESKVEVGEAYADLLRHAADVLASRRR